MLDLWDSLSRFQFFDGDVHDTNRGGYYFRVIMPYQEKSSFVYLKTVNVTVLCCKRVCWPCCSSAGQCRSLASELEGFFLR